MFRACLENRGLPTRLRGLPAIADITLPRAYGTSGICGEKAIESWIHSRITLMPPVRAGQHGWRKDARGAGLSTVPAVTPAVRRGGRTCPGHDAHEQVVE